MFRPTVRIAALQFLLGGISGAGAYTLGGKTAALSAIAGAVVAALATLVMAYRERQSEAHGDWNAERNLIQLYRSGFERLVLVLLLMGALFSLPGTIPLAVLAGFICAQLGWLAVFWVN